MNSKNRTIIIIFNSVLFIFWFIWISVIHENTILSDNKSILYLFPLVLLIFNYIMIFKKSEKMDLDKLPVSKDQIIELSEIENKFMSKVVFGSIRKTVKFAIGYHDNFEIRIDNVSIDKTPIKVKIIEVNKNYALGELMKNGT